MSATLSANLEDLYPLTPFQQGMLFHVLETPDAGVYLNQQRYTLRGNLDLDLFKNALQAVMNRHQILRTAFLLSSQDGPRQIVFRRLKLPWVMHDWSDLSRAEVSARMEALLQSDFQSGFDLKRAPLMRITLVRTEPDLYEFIWSFHLLLMDGWSMQVILRELLAFYHAFYFGQSAELGPPMPYSDFIKWLQRQPQDQAENYWRKTLQGFTSPTPLGFDRMPLPDVHETPMFKEKTIILDEERSTALRSFATQHRLTLNTVIQGAWALLISRRSGNDDVVFGSVVSGRSADIPKIDSAVGVFVNALPARVHIPFNSEVIPWLRDLQRQQVEARRFEFCSLVRIQGWSEVRNQPLFESALIFQNFPTSAGSPEAAGVKVIGVHLLERNNLPLALVVEPGAQFHFRLVYMSNRFDDATIDRIHENLRRVLAEIISPGAILSSISHGVNPERKQLIDSFNQSLASL